jgi:hypothetical protein
MSTSSGLDSSPVGVRGSSAMPQIGHAPGASRTISGCIGQVHSAAETGGRGVGDGESQRVGSARKRSAHPGLQKRWVSPACVTVARALSGVTVIPQTGSRLPVPGRAACAAWSIGVGGRLPPSPARVNALPWPRNCIASEA